MEITRTGFGRRKSVGAIALASAAALFLAGCGGNSGDFFGAALFSENAMGVSSSPRAVTSGDIPRGGGRAQIGQPYRVAGRWYEPRHQPDLDVTGSASWYGPNFHGRSTANGEVFDQYHLSGAHPTLPLPSYVRVTNLENGASTLVRINDRGPFAHNRVIDLSRRTAEVLGFINDGVANVRVQYVGPAPVDGDDTGFLVASINTPSYIEDPNARVAYQAAPQDQGATGQVASATSLDAIGNLIGGMNGTAPAPVMAYAQPGLPVDIDIFQSHDAAAAAADLTLEPWVDSLDEDARAVDIALGTFIDQGLARTVTERFALLGAVDTFDASVAGHLATQLRLSHLKPGVTHADVSNLAGELGLTASFL